MFKQVILKKIILGHYLKLVSNSFMRITAMGNAVAYLLKVQSYYGVWHQRVQACVHTLVYAETRHGCAYVMYVPNTLTRVALKIFFSKKRYLLKSKPSHLFNLTKTKICGKFEQNLFSI